MARDIGKKIKMLRTNQGMTLKELSSKTSLSTGFLSQLERGLTTVATDSLERIADVLGVDLTYFFHIPKRRKKDIMRSYEHEVFSIEDSKFIHYHISSDLSDKNIVPRLVQILPSNSDEEIVSYKHQGEEFVYVLEGVLSLYLNDERHELYPGDSAHINSNMIHNWANHTNKLVKILVINTPNSFRDREK